MKYVPRMFFKGGILGSVQNFWGDPYLNGTTILLIHNIHTALLLMGLHPFASGQPEILQETQ